MFKSLIYLEFIFVPEERQKSNLNFLKCKIKPTIFTQSTDYDLNWFQVSTSMYTQLMLLPELSVHSVMMHTCMSELGLSLSFLHWLFLENGTPWIGTVPSIQLVFRKYLADEWESKWMSSGATCTVRINSGIAVVLDKAN